MSSKPNAASEEDQLDAFLVSVESKLRGPFSSLDWTKSIQSVALRSDSTPREYLLQIRQVFARMDKVVQYRILVGLMGLDPSPDYDDLVYDILTDAEDEREEWVRMVAGLTRGILFQDHGDRSRESCRGEYAQELLSKTCSDVLRRLQSASTNDAEETVTDSDPLYVPYKYSLLGSDMLEQVIPELSSNKHFGINNAADVLNEDERAEEAKAKDGDQASGLSQRPSLTGQSHRGSMTGRTTPKTDLPFMPGIKSIIKGKGRKPPSQKSSMFMPTKPGSASSRRQLGNMKKTALHARRPGAAKALLSKRPNNAGSSTSTAGRASKYGGNNSKMKILDIADVQGLASQQNNRRDTKADRKRKLMEAAKAKGLVKKKSKIENGRAGSAKPISSSPAQPKKPPQLHANAAAAAVAAYQQKTAPAPAAPPPAQGQAAGNWEQLLERSNALKTEDHERIKQFFVDKINPTPEIPKVRIRLHEERSVEEGTGKQVKETLYLELDYETFNFKKLKKTKKK